MRQSSRQTKRGATVWRAADGPKPDDTYLTPREAQDALNALMLAERAKRRGPRPVDGKRFGDACNAWLEHAETIDGVEETTLNTYRSIVGKLTSAFQTRDAAAADRVEADHRVQGGLLADASEQALARTTIHTRMRVLSAMIERPEPDPDFNVLEPEEVERVAQAMAAIPAADLPRMRNGKIDRHALATIRERRPLWALAILLLAYTGLRFGEVRALRWRDIDFSGRLVHIRRNAPTSMPATAKRRVKRPKGRRGRSLPLIDQGVEVLRRIQAAGYPSGPDDLVLPTRGEGMMHVGRVRDAFYRGLRRTGLGHLRDKEQNAIVLHDLRHTFGTLAVRKLPLTDVQAFMGHQDIKTTTRYVHHVPRNDAAEVLSEAFAAAA
ncbi:MAG: site-specific integrase [Conexibacter sp.]|nr:site-specific integrase [Conexibacter sp.]